MEFELFDLPKNSAGLVHISDCNSASRSQFLQSLGVLKRCSIKYWDEKAFFRWVSAILHKKLQFKKKPSILHPMIKRLQKRWLKRETISPKSVWCVTTLMTITHADVWYFVSFAVHARVRVVNNRGVSDTSEMESESEYSQVWTTNSISIYLVFLDGNRTVAILTS